MRVGATLAVARWVRFMPEDNGRPRGSPLRGVRKTDVQIPICRAVPVEKESMTIAMLVTNCQRRHAAKFQFVLILCQVGIFAHYLSRGENSRGLKKWEKPFSRPKILCQFPFVFHSAGSLWKSPVEKAVESVENFTLSTGISLFCPDPAKSAQDKKWFA